MAAQDNDTDITWLDDTPPEARPPRPREPRRELLLSLLLLLSILGWTAWDTWRTQHLLASYQVGARAAAQYDWDGARAAYLAAEDYRDAQARAAAATTQITRRDTLYTASAQEAGGAEWIAALRDLRGVEAIQPGFRDSARLRTEAEQQVYTAALGGSIALRPAARPPGLYIYRAGRWVWLKDSDAASTVRGSGSGCYAVYDVPAPAAAPQPSVVDPSARGIGGVPGRRLLVARQQGATMRFQPLILPPQDFGTFTCGDQGVVALRYQGGPDRSNDPRLRLVANVYDDPDVQFQPYDRAITMTFLLPGTAWAVLDHSRADDVLVLGDYTRTTGSAPRTDVYLANVAGTRRLLAARDAVVQRAVLSPDGRFVLLDELGGSAGGAGYEHRLVLLTVDGTRSPVILRRSDEEIAPSSGWFWTWFISSGVYAGQALIGGPSLWDNTIELLDPTHPDQIRQVARLEANEQFMMLQPLASGLLLGWRAVTPTGEMRFAYFDRNGQTRPLDLRLPPFEAPWAVTQAGDSLVYVGAIGVELNGQRLHMGIQRLPLAGAGPPATLYEYRLLQNDPDGPAISWTLGPGALGVVHDGELHALSYDGPVDLVLERGIERIYSLPTP